MNHEPAPTTTEHAGTELVDVTAFDTEVQRQLRTNPEVEAEADAYHAAGSLAAAQIAELQGQLQATRSPFKRRRLNKEIGHQEEVAATAARRAGVREDELRSAPDRLEALQRDRAA